jgi:DDE_Tnp_1-associated/Transposase DDE domain
MERFRACFGDLADPRTGNAQRHDLCEILLIALAATLCGGESCVDMALFGRAKAPLLRRFLRLAGGVPSHDTFSRVFRLLDPDAFEASFGRFVAAFAAPSNEVVAVDGKTARRSFDRQVGRRPLHMVSAWACEQRLVLGQRRVDGASNEIEALPELLALLALDGRIVTADAMHCQKTTAQTILDRGGDYVLRSKATSRRCSRTSACGWTTPRPLRTTPARRSTAITAASRPAARRSRTMSPGSSITGSPASPRSPR